MDYEIILIAHFVDVILVTLGGGIWTVDIEVCLIKNFLKVF